MTTIHVQGEGWTADVVSELYKTESAFVSECIDNPGIYPGMDKEQKTATLKLAYSLCVPAKPEPIKEPLKEAKQSKAAITDGSVKPE